MPENRPVCLYSPTSIDGLRPLVRQFPETWPARIWGQTPTGGGLSRSATVRQVAATSTLRILMPRGPGDRARLASQRSVGRLLVDFCGAEAAGAFGPQQEQQLRLRLQRALHPRKRTPLSPKQRQRVIALRRACAAAVSGGRSSSTLATPTKKPRGPR